MNIRGGNMETLEETRDRGGSSKPNPEDVGDNAETQ